MKQLTAVHHGLRRLRRFRAMVRLGSAWSVALSVVLWALAAAFLLDYWMRMGRLERSILLILVAGAAAWALGKFLLPALRVSEDDVALALLVERRQGLSSDLVAALQFSDAGRDQYGSAGLREAVVDCTAEASGGLNFLEGFSREQLLRRSGLLAATAAVVVLPALLFPAHTTAFLQRLLLLSSRHYPTRTIIVGVESPAGRHAAYGREVVFRVRADANGVLPPAGRVELKALTGDMSTAVELRPDANDPTLYVGRLHRLLDDLSYTVYLGDAYTEPRELVLIPLPLVQVALDITPPDYAAAAFAAESEAMRQTTAPEGSRVGITVTADKKLLAGTLMLEAGTYPLAARDGKLALEPAGTPLEQVAEPMRFRVQVTDEHGLSLERPVTGTIQVSPDRPPRIAAAAVSRFVLPTASPTILLRAIDDYGVQRIRLHASIRRQDANTPETAFADPNATAATQPASTHTELTWTILEPPGHPVQIPMVEHSLKLQPLKLAKGDRVTVTMEAIDWRGSLAGKSGRSDPIVFEVTDRQGLLEAMDKLDERMIEKLTEIIQTQLGIGD